MILPVLVQSVYQHDTAGFGCKCKSRAEVVFLLICLLEKTRDAAMNNAAVGITKSKIRFRRWELLKINLPARFTFWHLKPKTKRFWKKGSVSSRWCSHLKATCLFPNRLLSTYYLKQTGQVRADAGKVHADQCARGRPEGEWPPGSKPYFGNPATSSPFVQCYLPQGFVFQGRKSKSLSFQEGPASTVRGICRSKEAAILGVQTWAWQWFNSLKKEDKSSLVETDALAERPAKKARVNWWRQNVT